MGIYTVGECPVCWSFYIEPPLLDIAGNPTAAATLTRQQNTSSRSRWGLLTSWPGSRSPDLLQDHLGVTPGFGHRRMLHGVGHRRPE